MQAVFVLILGLYPLRHIHWGLDLWDTGYNYANFEYMGLEHMDPMWLFSTYLANGVGHFLTKLPFGDSLVGMNLYTGLFVSVLALMGYFFCTRKLGIPSVTAFVGEFAAISLCWCPTALLYNYLTYVLFLGCVILLYKGLAEGKGGCLFAAGICLGTNVLVRFSNLPEAAMILAVWAYGVIEALEMRGIVKAGLTGGPKKRALERAVPEKGTAESSGAFMRTVRRTLWCLGGYLAALAVLLGYIHIRYGLDSYIAGILRLFAMTDNAEDYKAASMVMGMIGAYIENLYWVIRIFVIVAGGMILFGMVDFLTDRLKFFRGHAKLAVWTGRGVRALWAAVCICMLGWLYYRGFCALEYYHYGAILRPGILFLMLSMLVAVIRIIHPGSPKEEKLISGMVVLVILLTPLGSNNKLYPSLNNLFVAAPYTLWQCCRFFRMRDWGRIPGRIRVNAFPAKGVVAAFLALFLVQSVLFGKDFVFAESTGVQNVSEVVENNEVLEGVIMSPQRAEWMRSISAYVEENGLKGREVILYGSVPALSYYLQMPSAFNPWSDLASYSLETMEQDLAEVSAEMETARPVVILEDTYASYLEGGAEALEEQGVPDQNIQMIREDPKWGLLMDFLDEYGYGQTFRNEKFGIWE